MNEFTLSSMVVSEVVMFSSFVPSGVAKKYVDTNLVNTQQVLERTDRSDQSPAGPKRRLVRPVTPTGQTGWMQKTREDLEPQARRSGVVLRSAGHS